MKIKSIFIHFSIVTFCIVFSGHLLFGQQIVKINLTTPYHSIVNHLKYLQEDNYKPELSALSLYAPEKSLKEKEQLAIKLKQVYDGAGFFIEPDLLPKSSNFIDSLENKQIYYPARKQFPGLYLLKIEGYWYYSESSVNQIVKYHKEVYPMGTDKLLEIMPGTSSEKYLGIYLWQYVGLFMIIILIVFLHKIFSIIIEKVLLTLFTRIGYKNVAHKYLMPVAKPVSILVIFPILMLLIPVLMLPVKVSSFILLGIRVVWPVFAIIFFYRLVDVISIYLARMAEKTESTLDDQLVPLIRKAGKTFVVLVGMLVILDNLDVNITGIIAGLSIGGLAFALAAQDTIKNFFGSLMIFFDRPFQVGDWITSGDVDGTVEEVGFRATRIRTFRNSVMYIPNGVITNQMIDNHGLRVYRRFFTQLTVKYDTPPELLHVFTEGLKEVVNKHSLTRKDYYEVHVNNLGPSAIEVMFYIFFSVSSWSDELKARHEIILLTLKLAKEIGVEFAFPTQTLHVETLPKGEGTSGYITGSKQLQTKVENFLKKEFPTIKKED